MSSGQDVEIPEDAPRWAVPLFVGGHLRDVRLTAIEESCKAINGRLDQLSRSPLARVSPQTWAFIITVLVGAIAAVLGVSVPTTAVPPVDTAPPAAAP